MEKDKAYLFVDGRYIEYCKNNAKNVDVRLLTSTSLKEFFDQKGYKKIAIEKDYVIYETFQQICKLVKPEIIGLILGQELRIQKDDEERSIMQKSIDISLAAYNELME
ncbi:UNVERIFIED_CONTAM: hypothetical protein O8I53_05815 [Campylobacter lari]